MLGPRALSFALALSFAVTSPCSLLHSDDAATAPLQIGWGGVEVIGPADARVDDLERAVVEHLSAHGNLSVLRTPEIEAALSRARSHLLTLEGADSPPPSSAQMSAIVYLTAVTAPDALGEDRPFISAAVVWLRARSHGIFATSSVPLDAADCCELLSAEIETLLPPLGQVIGLIQTGDEVSVQLFFDASFTGTIAPGTELLLHRPRAQSAVSVIQHDGEALNLRVDLPGQRLCSVALKDAPKAGRVEAGVVSGEMPALGALVLAVPAGNGAYPELRDPAVLLTTPPGTLCRIEGTQVGVTPLVVEGSDASGAEAVFEREGHQSLTASLPPNLTGLAWWQGGLEEIPPFGTLQIVSQPTGATVFLGDEEMGETPLMLPKVAVGRHALQVRLPDHRFFTADVEIRLGQQTEIQAALVRTAQPVTISSDPVGADLLIGGERIGRTPVDGVSVPVGRHTLIARREGFSELRHTLVVDGDAPPEPIQLRLEPLPGSLTVVSEPRGAAVYLNGEAVGSTPLDLPNVAAGQHQLRIVRGGYEAWEGTVTIKPGMGERAQVHLTQLSGTLAVTTLPEEARVYLDGHLLGTTPLEGSGAAVGTREVVIRHDSYETWSRQVQIREGEETRISVALIEAAEHEPETPASLPPVTADGMVEIDLLGADESSPVKLRISIEEQTAGSRTVCRLWLSGGFPEQTRTSAVGKMISIVVPGLMASGELRSFDVSRGAISAIRVGQQSEREKTIRIELQTVLSGRVSFESSEDGQMKVIVASPSTRGERTSRAIALTFDDFPFRDSDRLLDVLDELGVPATLFVVGNKAEQYPDLLRRAVCAGHALENHSYSHPEFLQLNDDEVAEELRLCNEVIERITGMPPVLARPPGGGANGNHRALMRSLNLQHCGWTINTADYRTPDASAIARKVLDEAEPNAIVLMHDGLEATHRALREIIPRLRSRGYSFVTAREMAGYHAPSPEHQQVIISAR